MKVARALVVAVLGMAGVVQAVELNQRIAADSKFSFATLLRKVCPDLKVNPKEPATASASKSVAIRRLTGGDPPQEWNGEFKIQDVSKLDLRISGKPQALLMFTINSGEGDPASVQLALFDIAGARLLDVAEAPSVPDDPGSLWGGGFLHLNDSNDALVLETDHSNSSQGYQNLTIIFARDGRLRTIDTVSLLSCRGCQSGDFEEKAAISTAPDPERPYHRLLVRVTQELLPDPPDTRPRHRSARSVRYYNAEYRWDPAKNEYRLASSTLAQLAAFNEKNY